MGYLYDLVLCYNNLRFEYGEKMPTVLRINGYRFFFFSDEHMPQHIHIEKAGSYVRIVLDTHEVTDSYKISSKEINKLIKLVEENKETLKGAWDEYFKEQ